MRSTHRFATLLAAALLSGCGGIETVAPYAPITDAEQLFLALELDHAAANLSTAPGYDELQLTATPLDGAGNAMAGLPAPTFLSSDTTRVFVTRDGLLQGRRAATGIRVIAEIVAPGNIRRADTIYVNVRALASPPVLDRLTLEPDDPAGAVLAMNPTSGLWGREQLRLGTGVNSALRLAARAFATDGTPITGLAVAYESLDPEVIRADVRNGIRFVRQPGVARVVSRTTAYGVSIADTAYFTVTPPQVHGVVVNPASDGKPLTVEPRTLTIRPGGYVFFVNRLEDSISVSFEEPEKAGQIAELCTGIGATYPAMCDAGDIPTFMIDDGNDFSERFFHQIRGRQFTEPGEYPFRIEPLGVTGRIIVADQIQ